MNKKHMETLSHQSALPSHYNKEAEHYDRFNEKKSEATNRTIEGILKKYKVKSVLDLTCGTGSQVFWLAKRGYEVTGSDISAKMLKLAKDKAREGELSMRFLKGDMRRVEVGKFDAVITIFNAVGHLTKADFEEAMRNIHRNLKDGGLYIFDIFNLSYLMYGNNITKLTIDWQKTVKNTKVREIQYSTIDQDGVLASYTTSCLQKSSGKCRISNSYQTLQVYTAEKLKGMLSRNGFKVVSHYAMDGSKFMEEESERILTVAVRQ